MHVLHWAGLVVGGSLVLLSFVWDSPNIIAGGLPHRFEWVVFTTGELVSVSVFLHAVRRTDRTKAGGY
jgi:hypothetical protein